MKQCSYCGKEYGDEFTLCFIDGQPVGIEPSQPQPQPSGCESTSPVAFRYILSGVAALVSFAIWSEWAHTPDGTPPGFRPWLWSAVLIFGMACAVQGVRLARSSAGKAIAGLLIAIHCMSLLLLVLMGGRY